MNTNIVQKRSGCKQFRAYLFFFFLQIACQATDAQPKGKLYIIGGGTKPPEMIKELVQLSGTDVKGYMLLLPMASETPDSIMDWIREDFINAGVQQLTGFNIQKGIPVKASRLDSIRSAALIYISGGDQLRFMSCIEGTAVQEALRDAYLGGAVISGTSAGAAVMSKKMITGNQLKHTQYTGEYPSIENDNIEIATGLGFLEGVIIDQHFIKRQRMNRMMAVAIENPGDMCIGIDESTAILVEDNRATVKGKSQVVVLQNPTGKKTVQNGLLGAQGMQMSIYLPGEQFMMKK